MRKTASFLLCVVCFLHVSPRVHAEEDSSIVTGNTPLIIGLLDSRGTLTGIARQAALERAQKELRFTADMALFPPEAQNGNETKKLVDVWRERVDARLLSSYEEPQRDGSDYCSRPDCTAVYDDPSQDRPKAVRKVVTGETLRFVRQNSPLVEEIVTTLRLDVSGNPTKNDPPPALKGMEPVTELPTKKEVDQKGLSFKTRLRLRIDGGSIEPTVETQAKYQAISSYYRINLHTIYDTRLGLQYLVATDVRLVLERETKLIANPTWETDYQERTSKSTLRLVIAF